MNKNEKNIHKKIREIFFQTACLQLQKLAQHTHKHTNRTHNKSYFDN